MSLIIKYIADPPLRFSGQFDILSWWKNQVDEYPILAKIARDLFAVQVSTVLQSLLFSAGGCVIDPFRNYLEPEMVEASMCTKDWVAAARFSCGLLSCLLILYILVSLQQARFPYKIFSVSVSQYTSISGCKNQQARFNLQQFFYSNFDFVYFGFSLIFR